MPPSRRSTRNTLAALFLSAAAIPAHAQPFRAAARTGGLDYVGTYVCVQGLTDLDLKILPSAAPSHHRTAIFTFWPPASGSAAHPQGAFTMHGTLNRALGTLSLTPGHWLKKPWFFSMVAMSGTSNDGGATFTGKIIFPGCTHFSLRLHAP